MGITTQLVQDYHCGVCPSDMTQIPYLDSSNHTHIRLGLSDSCHSDIHPPITDLWTDSWTDEGYDLYSTIFQLQRISN